MNHCDFGTPMRRSCRFKSKTICCVAQRVNFTGMSDDLRLLRTPWRIRLLTLVPMLKFRVVLASGRRHGCAASTICDNC
jgi:hypothetical protein